MTIAIAIVFFVGAAICLVQTARNWSTPAGIAWAAGAVACSFAALVIAGR